MRACLLLLACLAAWSTADAAPPSIASADISRMSTPWWAARFAAKQHELQTAPSDIVWLGDSITQDWELDGPEDWRRFAPIWNRFYGGRGAVNLGFKGDSTCHVLWRLDHGELAAMHPKVVVLLIGANNFGHVHTDAAATYAAIRLIVERLRDHAPAARIIVIGVLPSIRSAWVDANTRALNAMLRAGLVGERGVSFVDLASLFMRDGRVDASAFLDPHLTPPAPPLHPTAASQERIATAIEPLVAAGLREWTAGLPALHPRSAE